MTVSAHSNPAVEAPTTEHDAILDTDAAESPTSSRSSIHSDGTPLSPRAWFPVAGSMIAVAWGGNEFTPLLVMYRETSNFSQVTVNGLLAAYVVGIIPALLIGGPLSDLLGRRPLLLPAAPLSLAGSFLLSIAPNEPLIIALGRVLCGMALGLVMAVGSTWITELITSCLLYTSPSPRDGLLSRMPSSA